jgi:hypothetical protein
MKRRQRWLERLSAVDREYSAAELADEFLRAGIKADPTRLVERGLSPKDVNNFSDNVEATYFIRLFAEFESALRDVWANGYNRTTEPPTRVLIDSVGARCNVSDTDVEAVHRVREYRNMLVHEGDDGTEAVGFETAKSDLGRFLARLPLDW